MPYNPLDKRNLGLSVAEALLQQPVHPLPPQPEFEGAGTYAIYYTGPFPSYSAIAARNSEGRFDEPIYVGKAVPPGARKGLLGLGEAPGNALHNRLREHAGSIEQARNLDLTDFCCRYLVVDDIWIPLGESLLVARFQPVWNCAIDGFGNHDPGSGRYNQQRSPWDVMHPGRIWAERLQKHSKSAAEIHESVARFLGERDSRASAA